MVSIETAVVPADLDGTTFLCEATVSGADSISFSRAEDGNVTVYGYSPCMEGMLAKALPSIMRGERKGVIQFGGYSFRWIIKGTGAWLVYGSAKDEWEF